MKGRGWETALWFSLASLTKETAILAPLALLAWDVLSRLLPARDGNILPERQRWNSAWLLVPIAPLAAWYGFHYWRTGFVFGNPEFFRYNVQATLNPLRIVLALLVRLWQILGYFRLLMLTLATLFAMWLPPLRDPDGERPRIALDVQFAMLSVIVAYVLAMALVGGAELARYMLPVVPLGDPGLRFHAVAPGSAVARRDRDGGAAVRLRDGLSIRLTVLLRKTTWLTATTSVCTSAPRNFWKRAIPWRASSRHGRRVTN